MFPPSLLYPVGGILNRFSSAWGDQESDVWVTKVIKEGYKIPFVKIPTLASNPIALTAYHQGSDKFQALESEVSSMLQKEAIEEV